MKTNMANKAFWWRVHASLAEVFHVYFLIFPPRGHEEHAAYQLLFLLLAKFMLADAPALSRCMVIVFTLLSRGERDVKKNTNNVTNIPEMDPETLDLGEQRSEGWRKSGVNYSLPHLHRA